MAVNEGKDTLSLAEKDELREALAVLAGSDPDNCSYPQGYVKRQAIFACNTCTTERMPPAGICLACANDCHDGHDVFELYTKRNFRCDCGNKKFGSFKCKLNPEKEAQNIKNLYNHNFFGRYCSCDRPYPDDDDQVGEEMIQCIVCEDWYHSKHLGCAVVDSEELLEMVCESCMNRASFLWTYAAHTAFPPVSNMSLCKEDEDVTVVKDEEKKAALRPCRTGPGEASTSQGCQKEAMHGANVRAVNHKRTHEEMERHSAKDQFDITSCKLKELKDKGLARPKVGAVFWPYSWRAELCKCTSCKREYVEAGVQFLLDESDTVLAYEDKGRTPALLGEDLLLTCLSSLDRVQQLEIVYQFNDMKAELHEFLQQYVDQGKVVTAEAICTFFEELQTRKKRQSSTGQHYSS